MAQIDPPLLPPRLYRYRDVSSDELADRELEAISGNYVWCSRYPDLNDPMEGIYGTSPWLARQSAFEKLASEILDQKRSVGICCFSDTYDNELMWAHYAGNYSGICVAYSTWDLCAGLDDNVHVARVAYGSVPPRIGRGHKDEPQQAARTILSHKKSSWLYEREWRLLTNSNAELPGGLHFSRKNPVKAVYLGHRIKEGVRTKLETELTEMRIKIHILKVPGYQHTWAPLKTTGEVA